LLINLALRFPVGGLESQGKVILWFSVMADEKKIDEDGENLNKKESGKGAKKFFLLIILAIVMIVVIGGTTAAYFTGLLNPVIAWATGSENAEGEGIQKFSEKKEGQIKILIDMDPLAIPIFQGNSVAATVRFNIKLETNDEEKAERIRKILPIIADAFISDLHGFMPRLLKAKKKVDYEIVTQRLQLIVDKVTGKGTVSKVIAKSVNEQPG